MACTQTLSRLVQCSPMVNHGECDRHGTLCLGRRSTHEGHAHSVSSCIYCTHCTLAALRAIAASGGGGPPPPQGLAKRPAADKTQGQHAKMQKTFKTAVQGPQTPRQIALDRFGPPQARNFKFLK